MKLTNNLLNNQNYVIDDKKREQLEKLYYSIHKPHHTDTLLLALVLEFFIIIGLMILNIWVWEKYWEVYFLFSLPFSFFFIFYSLFKVWFVLRYFLLKNRYFVIFNTFHNSIWLQKLYSTLSPEYFISTYFFKIRKNKRHLVWSADYAIDSVINQ